MNVLCVISDDLNCDAGCYDSPNSATPRLVASELYDLASELYDLASEPAEETNRIDHAAHRSARQKLSLLLEDYRAAKRLTEAVSAP